MIQAAEQFIHRRAFLDLHRLNAGGQQLLDRGRADGIAIHGGAAFEQRDLAGQLAFVAIHGDIAVVEFGHFHQTRVVFRQAVDAERLGGAEVLIDDAPV